MEKGQLSALGTWALSTGVMAVEVEVGLVPNGKYEWPIERIQGCLNPQRSI